MIKIFISLFLVMLSNFAMAIDSAKNDTSASVVLFWIFAFIFLSRSLSIVKKIGIPIIVAEILTGIILGDIHLLGVHVFQDAENNPIIKFLAEFGAIILMFEIGLDSKLSELKLNFKVGFVVAAVGSIFTFLTGYLVSKYLIQDSTTQLNLLMGIITAATATGISARTFKDMKIIKSKEVKIILVSSIIDELISIFCFGIISGLILENSINLLHIAATTTQLVAFFAFAAIFGQWITPFVTHWSTKIHAGINMKIGVLFGVCFFFSWIAYIMGLATVLGAFIAGLILDQVYFRSFSKSNFLINLRKVASDIDDAKTRYHLVNLIEKQEKRTLEELLKPFAHIFTPLFFIYIGLMLNIEDLLKPNTLLITLILLCASFIGRILSGYTLQHKGLNKLIIGLGMTPIGEAGLIFAVFGKNAGLISAPILSAIVATLVISSIITPIFIKLAANRGGIHYE